MRNSLAFMALGLSFLTGTLRSQEIGANFNHNPEIIDFNYLEKSEVEWIRTTPRILDYVDKGLEVENDPALQKVIEAGKKGYKVAFGFRWDFNKRDMRIPAPFSSEERQLFDKAREILQKVGPYVNIFKLGNEPNLETMPQDMQQNSEGYIPLVKFSERLLEEVVEPYYKEGKDLKRPDIYVGSFPRLFMPEEQNNAGVKGMILFAEQNPAIAGLAVHLHISDSTEIDDSFKFVRKLMPEKPIIVPEFSYHRLYTQKLNDPIGKTQKGKVFLQKYNRNPQWKLYDWFGFANREGVSKEEWEDFFATLEWFPKNNLLTYYDRFEKYGVVLATYPILQQSAPENMTANSPAWFINPIFAAKSLKKQEDGSYSPNPLHYEDFLEIVRRGKKIKG